VTEPAPGLPAPDPPVPDPGLPAPEPADPDPSVTTAGTYNGGPEPTTGDQDQLTYGQTGSYVYEQTPPFGYAPDAADTPGYPADESGYNPEMSQPAAGGAQPPPYPAELPPQEPATAPRAAGLVSAATRVLPRPRAKNQAPKKQAPKSQAPQARRANLVIARIEPWSVMKFSFLMSLVAWVVLFVAVALLYYALSGLGVFAALQRTLQSVTSSQTSSGVNLAQWTSASRVLGYTMLLGAVNIILITVLSTIGAMIYNLVTHLGGGIEVTLKETD
jgi:hypothetical protein